MGAEDTDALNQLKQIKQPVLVINGSNDIVVPTVNSYTLFQNIPNAQSSLFPDSGHGSIFQYPDWFLKEAIPFLNNAEEYQMIYRLNNKKTLINRGFFVFAYEHFFL